MYLDKYIIYNLINNFEIHFESIFLVIYKLKFSQLWVCAYVQICSYQNQILFYEYNEHIVINSEVCSSLW